MVPEHRVLHPCYSIMGKATRTVPQKSAVMTQGSPPPVDALQLREQCVGDANEKEGPRQSEEPHISIFPGPLLIASSCEFRRRQMVPTTPKGT